MSIDRIVMAFAGFMIMLTVALGWDKSPIFHHEYWFFFTAFVGLMAAPVPVHPMIGFCAILFIAIGGGASGALNMWWDADIDRVMRRTRNRPIPSGKVQPGEAMALGVALSGMAVIMLALATYMGHVSIHSTQVYLRPTAELMEQVNRRFYQHYRQYVQSSGDPS